MQATDATWGQTDWLHPGPAGYQEMGETQAGQGRRMKSAIFRGTVAERRRPLLSGDDRC
jgi:hypothetical protein